MDRTIERILAEWRAAEARLRADPQNVDLQELVATLRDEHLAALEARMPDVDTVPELDPI